jgi:predicted nucleic acid-binding protein
VIVVDASAIVDLVTYGRKWVELRDRLRRDEGLHAPHIVDVEVAGALRRLATHGTISSERADDARHNAALLPIIHYPHRELVGRAWELRGHLTIADGVYVALAEALEAPLLTTDARLARTAGHNATIELV